MNKSGRTGKNQAPPSRDGGAGWKATSAGENRRSSSIGTPIGTFVRSGRLGFFLRRCLGEDAHDIRRRHRLLAPFAWVEAAEAGPRFRIDVRRLGAQGADGAVFAAEDSEG